MGKREMIEQFRPIPRKKPAPFKKRKSKDGRETVWDCPFCSEEYVNRYSCYKHALKCPSRTRNRAIQLVERTTAVENRETEIEARQMIEEIERQPEVEVQGTLVDANNQIQKLTEKVIELNDEISRLKRYLRIEDVREFDTRDQARKWAKEFLDETTAMTVKGIIFMSVQEAFFAALSNNVDIRKNLNNLRSALYRKLSQLQLYQDIDSYREKLQKYHNSLIKQLKEGSKKRVPSTIYKLNSGYNFLMHYNEIDMKYQEKITQDLMNSSVWKREVVISYYNRMRRDQPASFSHFPPISKRVRTYKSLVKAKLPTVALDQIIDQVNTLYQANKGQLATDLWMCCCLGFRKDDLLRVFFTDQDGVFARAISLVQNKNKHFSLRIVPQSLKKLIKTTQTSFPMPFERFQAVRAYCLKNFNRFYSLRSLCITTISAAIAAQSRLGKFHHDSRTTSRFYIDDTNQKFINSAFELNFGWLQGNFESGDFLLEFGQGFHPQIQKTKNQSCLIKGQADQIIDTEELDCKNNMRLQDVMQEVKYNQAGLSDLEIGMLAANTRSLKENGQVVQQDKCFADLGQLIRKVSDDEQAEMLIKLEMLDISLGVRLGRYILNQDVDLEAMSFRKMQEQANWDDIRVLQFFAKLYRLKIRYWQWRTPFEEPISTEYIVEKRDKNLLIVIKLETAVGTYYTVGDGVCTVEYSQQYHAQKHELRLLIQAQARRNRPDNRNMQIQQAEELDNLNLAVKAKTDKKAQKQLQLKKQIKLARQSKTKALRRISAEARETAVARLKIVEPTCQFLQCRAKRSRLLLEECAATSHKHFVFKCVQCEQVSSGHDCRNWSQPDFQYLSADNIFFTPVGKSRDKAQFQSLATLEAENNIREVVHKRGYIYTDCAVYLPDVPRSFECQYTVLSKEQSAMILSNRLEQSRLPLQIRPSTMKQAGLGVFATRDIEPKTLICSYLGEIATNESASHNDSLYTLGYFGRRCLLISPCKYANVGRFLNSSAGEQSNCKPQIGIVSLPFSARSQQRRRFEVTLFIVSTRKIEKGKELKYNYGSLYLMNQNKPDLEE